MFEVIEKKRTSLGISRAEMCRKLGVCRKTYVNWQNGRKPRQKTVEKALSIGESVVS